MSMNICILGSGGREAAIAWKIRQSPSCEKLFILPGNGGSRAYGEPVNLDYRDMDSFSSFLLQKNISMLIIGPEEPLVNGITDRLREIPSLSHVQIIGPSAEGAMLEGSKSYAKEFMSEFGIPTANYGRFNADQLFEARQFLRQMNAPYVLKADGLAAGKGVLILESMEEAEMQLELMLAGKFGTASNTVVIEEFLDGIEFSVFVITDGKDYQILPVAKDYKRRGEGDTGLNTGGMGAVSPVPFVDDDLMHKVEERIIKPTIQGIQSRQIDYRGFIFFGLINVNGDPYVIEYNCRMGDPETEVVIPRLKTDLLVLLQSLFEGTLNEQNIKHDERTAATIMLVSEGYPGSYQKGFQITGLEQTKGSIIFHAGTREEGGRILSHGGRVIAVTSLADSMEQALSKSLENIGKIHFKGMNYRKDIGFDL